MSDDTFASLFEAQPKSAVRVRDVRVGETIEGSVVQVTPHAVFIEIDGRKQAFLDGFEVRNEKGEIELKIGDKVVARVASIDNETGEIRVSRSLRGGGGGNALGLQEAKAARLPVEGKVTGVNKGGLEVDLPGGNRGFCPLSQVADRRIEDVSSFVGQKLSFLVTEIKDGGRSIVLSRRALIAEQSKMEGERVLATLEKGKLVRGTVTSVRNFGAFVDLGGLEALIPASEASHDRRANVADLLKAGDSVEAQVLDIKLDEKGQTKVSLSLKALVEAPPNAAPTARASKSRLAIGAVVEGEVTRIETYGIFLQITGTEGRDGSGLVPASELGVPRGTDLRKNFPIGTKLTASVMETGGGKLKLSVKGAKDALERADFEAHRGVTAATGFGTFGELLKKAGAKKK